MKKNIWILNHYAGGMYFDKGGRHYNFAKYLKRAGYKPVVFCANSKHGNGEFFFNNDVLWQEKNAEEINTPFIFVKTCSYVGNGKQRIFNMVEFYNNVKRTCKEYAKKYGKPDIIYASSVHPLAIVAGIQLAKYFGVECIGEVRDLWPMAIVEESGLKVANNKALMHILFQGEKWIYKKVDKLIFTIEGGYDYIKDKKWERVIPKSKVYHINNGIDIEDANKLLNKYKIDDEDLLDNKKIKIIYTGSVRHANKLDILLDLAKTIEKKDILFLIYGSGDDLETLQMRCKDEHLENIKFKGRVNKKYIPFILSKSNFTFLCHPPLNLFKYGSSNNKLFDYLACGKPIFSTIDVKYSIINRYTAGIESSTNISENFQKLINSSKTDYDKLCENSLVAANDYDFKNLTKKLIEIIEK